MLTVPKTPPASAADASDDRFQTVSPFGSVLSESSTATSSPQIRHAGRAHIRGKIRRVWRPRYLELWDNGLVRYYELPASADIALQQDSDWDHVNMIGKYTLAVYHARILDVTTLRDMHVGLPHGAFGFLFRGQRLMHLEHETTALTVMSATTGSMNMTKCQEPVKEQRDFLCAVSSLEEAQMWVVALQWAGVVAHQTLPAEPWWRQEGEVDSDVVLVRGAGSEETEDEQQRARQHQQEQPRPNPKPVVTTWHDAGGALVEDDPLNTVLTDATALRPHRAPATTRRSRPFGKVVVSKVVQYRVVRLSAFSFEIAYEIHGMLLRQRVSEQWSMLRTADDLQNLVRDLCKELGPSLLDRAHLGPIRRLPRLAQKPKQEALIQSVSIMDSIFRSLVMDGSMVNTLAMKAFLGLAQQPRPSLAFPILSSLSSSSLTMRLCQTHDAQAVLERTTETLPEQVTTDHYVKSWLQERNPPSTLDAYAVLVWRRPLVFLGAAGLSAVAMVPLAHLWQQVMPRMTVRMDALVVSWISAAYLGRLYDEKLAVAAAAPGRKKPTLPSSLAAVSKPSSAGSISARHRMVVDKETHLPRKEHKREDDSDYSDAAAEEEDDDLVSAGSFLEEEESEGDEMMMEGCDGGAMLLSDEEAQHRRKLLSSPLPRFPENNGESCWSEPDHSIFHVRGSNYLQDRIKIPSDASPLTCRGVDVWITDNPERHIARHPAVLGGRLGEEDTFLVNFLLPFGNFVAYFSIPPISKFPKKLRNVWTKFLKGDQQYRDQRLKLLPVVCEGPWIVKTAVGAGKSPALLGKVIPLQYFFRDPDRHHKGVYEVDVIITASTIAKGILSVVKGHTNSVSIAFAFIIEAAEQDELPETVLCSLQVHSLHLEDCPILPECNLDETSQSSA